MFQTFAGSLDALGQWRGALAARAQQLVHFLSEHQLLDEATEAQLDALRQRIDSEKLIVAFVAEFSRGKSELINAIFFADAGRRVLPATLTAAMAMDGGQESLVWTGTASAHSIRRVPAAGAEPRAWRARIDTRNRLNDHGPIPLEGEKPLDRPEGG